MRRCYPLSRSLILVLALALGWGCPKPAPRYVADAKRQQDLPKSPAELIQLADQLVERGAKTLPQLDRALAALERAQQKEPEPSFAVQWRLARASFLMTEVLANPEQRRDYAEQGIRYAQQALQREQKRVEPYYYLALNVAKVAEVTRNLDLLQEMLKQGEIAAKVDEAYDDAGPLRFMGKVYLSAPAWPVSVGSSEKAVELLERAVKLAPVPLNLIFLGEAYYHDEEYESAKEQLDKAFSVVEAKGLTLDPRWQKEAQDYLRRLAAKGYSH